MELPFALGAVPRDGCTMSPSRSSGGGGVRGHVNGSLLHGVLRASGEVFYGSTKKEEEEESVTWRRGKMVRDDTQVGCWP